MSDKATQDFYGANAEKYKNFMDEKALHEFQKRYLPGTRVVFVDDKKLPEGVAKDEKGTVQFVDDLKNLNITTDSGLNVTIPYSEQLPFKYLALDVQIEEFEAIRKEKIAEKQRERERKAASRGKKKGKNKYYDDDEREDR